jgi:outer membrane protein OmpA-like peptidoglycan-associated protein
MNDLGLGEFVNRDTFRIVRDYPHPIERLWDAVTDREQLSVWLWQCPQLVAAQGSEFVFDFGFGKLWHGQIAAFQRPYLIDFGGFLRFELSRVPNGSRLAITQKRNPAGWSPMALAGFHGWLGRLARLLARVPNDVADRWANEQYPWEALFLAYERLIRDSLAGGAIPIYRLHFAENTSTLSPEAEAHLDELVRVLKSQPALGVTIDGFGDDPCTQEESVALAAKRIETARHYLEAAGISLDRVVVGFTLGNYHFVVPRETATGRAFNRRIELRPIY